MTITTHAHRLRATQEYSKPYLDNLVKEFAWRYISTFEKQRGIKIQSVEIMKQDMRGVPSITLLDTRHCVPHQKHFNNNAEIISYMQGFIAAHEGQV